MSTWGTTTAAPAARAGTVDVLVGLLAELDEATESGVFYDRVCQAVVTLTSMKRAVLLLHDETYRSVIPVGSSGLDTERLRRVGGTLDETPIAQIALEEDRVVEVGVNGGDGDLAEHLPARYAELPESAYLTCTPISAARRWLGVIFADREGDDFPLDDGESETMMTLGRLAALTASVEHSTEQRESERRLAERVELTRDLHENAIQRLFGVAMALGSDEELTNTERQRCQEELRSVVADLRRALTRPLETPDPSPKACLGELLDRLTARRPELRVDWADGVEVPADLEPVAQLVLNEALRNADRHARPTEILVRLTSDGATFRLSIENDGSGDGRTTRGGGIGLRLAALEALRYEGLVEFGATGGDRWRVRLVVPMECG
ncbi:MAG TPA: GAF domain-containing protein [Solirubrobacterales bacterium]|jgi:nitrate/nitrite-specific signal transduction histidine kinase